MTVSFYAWDGCTSVGRMLTLDPGYSWRLWKPCGSEVTAPGLRMIPFAIWWLMDRLRVFGNRDYGVFCVYSNGELVHRSTVSPRYFRFRFMAKDDLQTQDVSVSADYSAGSGTSQRPRIWLRSELSRSLAS